MFSLSRSVVLFGLVSAVAGCADMRRIVLVPEQANAVAFWHDVGAETVNASGSGAITDEEKYAAFSVDMATMHVAIYDAVSAIDGRHQPLYAMPRGGFAGASLDAATGAAAYGVMRMLFPSRASHYQQAYDDFIAALPAGDAKARGIALGGEVAAVVVAKRASDGRATALPDYMPSTLPGMYRGRDPVLRRLPSIRPFTLASMAQFRPPPPPALDSAEYAVDLNEVKAYGGRMSSGRSMEQLELARFHTELPQSFIVRNFGRFARSTSNVGDAARLMAVLYVGFSDAIGACFEAKYYYNAWRPLSAIPLADTDGNPATAADANWTPALPTPPHPEYPAGHSCSAGAVGELLRRYYGSEHVSYSWDSTATNTLRTYAGVNALTEESVQARIYGGMHFRYATTAGAKLGKDVADWTMRHAFMERPR